jgi:transposase
LGTRRATCLLDGAAPEPGGGRPPPRRPIRERGTLLKERTRQTNRIRGLLFGQGITDDDPLGQDCLRRLEALRTGDGRPLPERLKAEIRRALERTALVCRQLAEVGRARDALIGQGAAGTMPKTAAAALVRLEGIGPELGSLLWLEALFRGFANRRQIASYAGLAPSPWQSGGIDQESRASANPATAACAMP